MSNILRGLFGLSLASVVRGIRFGPQQLRAHAVATTQRINPLESTHLRSLPVRTLEDVIGQEKVSINLGIERYEDGMLPLDDAVALLTVLALTRPKVVLEIGTFMGYTSKSIAMNLPHVVVHTLDLPLDFQAEADQITHLAKDDFHLINKRSPGREFVGTEYKARIHQHFGDSATWDYQQASGATFFFIDGSHTYDYCRVDSEKCFELCGGHGVFLWHDCDDDHPGVARVLAEWRAKGRDICRLANTRLGYWDSRASTRTA